MDQGVCGHAAEGGIMFIQIIQGQVADHEELRQAFDDWYRDLAPGATGWLGSTAGLTADGYSFTQVRFESAESARRNSNRPEQHQWWVRTSKLYAGDVAFHDCADTTIWLAGGSDDAGFVQVMQGRTSDLARLREIGRQFEELAGDYRPDIIGGVLAGHDGGWFTETIYFTSEAEAREGERREAPPRLRQLVEEEQRIITDLRYYDLIGPWLYSPAR